MIRNDVRGLSRPLFAVLLAALLFGCTESQRQEANGKGSIRGVNAISTAPAVTFLIEERSLGTLSYKEVTSAQDFDDLSFNFNFDVRLPGDDGPRRLATEPLKVERDNDYVFALTGSLDQPSIIVWETPERMWNGDETSLEASAGDLAPGTGTVDVYLAAP
ncbi:MAG TPA: DUF4397 domain-containing protein, partial [Woeseiaceae bacterium]|nr:DUF4397 domain-containing protein [Woeseiaceae bacterium]